ncbi:probable prolyl 4-hydroxylase 9 isoform X3 [Lycium ferocissimum]|uniref:probable prolyl 4-hydroxylase 9 isoform X3 n=1 Tax=Lycium ferocissimum TaxID=112874 RepID=UPI002815C6DF|nr:probable prolyl 4-hydroxylase 9 isoform X3 [Lycium ferocissimum]
MRSRGKSSVIGLPFVFLLCLFFFLLGFLTSSLFSQQDVPVVRPRPRALESVDLEKDFDPLPIGETGEHSLTSIPFQVLSWYPRALYFPNFASIEQCQSIIKIAKANLEPSSLALRKGETEDTTKGIRTSSGTFISASEDKTGILDRIEEKIAKATMIPKTHGEAFNVLRYEIGQRYQSHYDAFDPAQYGPQKSQRNGQNMDGKYDFSKCIGLKVKPRRGDGLLFYSLFPNGTIDLTSLHGSCPVIRGEKWVATKWIRNIEPDE